jgi:hypothetical protein
MDSKWLFGRAMRTGPAIAWALSGLDFSRMVLDFLFCCHNLKVHVFGGRAAIVQTIRFAPFFVHQETKPPISRATKWGGVLF